MATATATPKIDVGGPKGYRIFNDNDMAHVFGTIAISASPATYLTGGLPLNFLGVTGFPSPNTPYWVWVTAADGQVAYQYQWRKSTGNLIIYTAGAELANALAIPAVVSGDTIQFEAVVQRA